MNKNFYPTKIFGQWTIDIETPFGKEACKFEVDSDKSIIDYGKVVFYGKIFNEKSFIDFPNGKIKNNALEFCKDLDFPIHSKVTLVISQVDDNQMSGFIKVDDYVNCLFTGSK